MKAITTMFSSLEVTMYPKIFFIYVLFYEAWPVVGNYTEEHLLLPANYNKEFHPWTSADFNGSLNVNVAMTIISISGIDEEKSMIHMSLIMRSKWVDPRFLLPEYLDDNDFLIYSAIKKSRLWVPDYAIIRAWSVREMSVYSPMEALQVFGNRSVYLASMLLMDFQCDMKYTYYPLDEQICQLAIESSGYPVDRLNISWDTSGVSLLPGFSNAHFDVSVSKGFTRPSRHSGRMYAGIGFDIRLARKVEFYLLQTYMPSALLVLVAGVSFLVPPSCVPGRMVLCITTLLAVTTMFAAERQAGPRVSYIKAMDVWMLGCMFFTFYSTFEYALVIRLGLNQAGAEKERVTSCDISRTQPRSGLHRAKIVPVGQERTRHAWDSQSVGHAIEKWSLRCYGCLFLVFNIVYWVYYTQVQHEE